METKWILLFVLLVFIGIAWVVTQRCPACKRLRVLKATDETREESFTGSTFVEWRCVNCDYTEWRALARKPSK